MIDDAHLLDARGHFAYHPLIVGGVRDRNRSFSLIGAAALLVAGGCGGGKGSAQGAAGASATGGTSATGGANASGGAAGKSSPGGAGGSAGADGGQQPDGGADALVIDPALLSFCQSVRGVLVSQLGTCNGNPPVIAQQLENIDPCAAWGTGVAAGTMSFDATNADACVSALQSLACDADALPSICGGVLVGLVQSGGACNMARQLALFSDCQDGTACLAGANACQGTCTARGTLNQPCTSVPCVSGTTCNFATNTCAPKGALNDACGATGIAVCGPGLYCTDSLGSGTCAAQAATGSCYVASLQPACAPPAQCNSALSLNGTCGPPPKPGDPCTVGDYDCGTDLRCAADSTCQAYSPFGQPCLVNGDGEAAPVHRRQLRHQQPERRARNRHLQADPARRRLCPQRRLRSERALRARGPVRAHLHGALLLAALLLAKDRSKRWPASRGWCRCRARRRSYPRSC